jgi:hypothetical protein
MRRLVIAPILVVVLTGLAATTAHAQGPSDPQAFTFDAFVGTWEGTISSQHFGGYSEPITLDVQADGTYTDSSGRLMPTIYPDTQQCEYDEATNRVHFWYLQTVYAGQYFYQHIYFEVVSYTGDTLELHYNFWDDPEPHPEAQTIALVRAGVTSVGDDRPTPSPAASAMTAFPNPFNPATRVAFDLPRGGAVTLEVVDLRGRRVAVLHDGVLEAGRHEIEWRGRDRSGLPARGGVYLARLVTADGVRTAKLTLAK